MYAITPVIIVCVSVKRGRGWIACKHLRTNNGAYHLKHSMCSYLENSGTYLPNLLANNGANVFVRSYDVCRKIFVLADSASRDHFYLCSISKHPSTTARTRLRVAGGCLCAA